MTAKDLKNALLQEAVQGKLVPQIASEGNARNLLEEIRKERLSHGLDFANAKSGKKSKKETALAGSNPCDIPEDEIPFDIPENWCWCRQSDIANISTGMTPLKSESRFYEDGNIPWITSSLTNNEYIENAESFITEYAVENTSLTLYPKNTLILAMYGQGKTRGQISELLIPATINQACAAIELFLDDDYFRKYIKLFHNWNYNNVRKEASGSAQPNLNLGKVQSTLIPLPPLSEQKRIVAAIEKFMPFIEEYGKKETALNELNAQIGTLTKKAILQEAVQGKLVPQIPAEGSAKDLLEQIRKERLSHGLDFANAKSGKKSKKETALAGSNPCDISEDEIPFDIPESWCWCRLGELGNFIRGSGIKRDETTKEGFPCVRYGEMYTTYKLKFTQTKSFTSKEVFDKCHKIHSNDILMALTGENKWDIALAAVYEGNDELAMGGDLCKFTPCKCDSLFLVYLINSPYGIEYKRNTSTGDIIVHTSTSKLGNFLIPLPPLSEQKRIVEAIEKMLPLCDKLGK